MLLRSMECVRVLNECKNQRSRLAKGRFWSRVTLETGIQLKSMTKSVLNLSWGHVGVVRKARLGSTPTLQPIVNHDSINDTIQT